jgi:branched-subunit amino acid aminotransferase/4-amino-4-deoxychorismate lyase
MNTFQSTLESFQKREDALKAREDPFADGIAWVEGEIMPLSQARIPLADQGFLHGDLTYDVPAVWDGRIFRLDDHLDRLEASCHKLRLFLPKPKEEIKQLVLDLISKSGFRDAYVELIVTRGIHSIRTLDMSPAKVEPNLYLFVTPYVWVVPMALHSHGAAAIVTRTVRRIPPGAVDPTVKNLQWGDFNRAILETQDRGAQAPFLTDGDSNLTEGSGFNIFIVKGGVLHTARRGVLEGITRRTVLEIAEDEKIPCHVEDVPMGLVYSADEIFICTTAGGLMPITGLDGQPVADGKVGPITSKFWDAYWALHYDPKLTIDIMYG